jgi:hypothetical protein
MKWNRPWAWLLAAVPIVLVVVSFRIVSSTRKIPVYQGKTYYEWANELQKAQTDFTDNHRWQKIEKTSAAIRAMGTNALPFVMDDLRAQLTLQDKLISWVAPYARFLKLKPVNIGDRWSRGVWGMEALGPLGKPYLPELITMVSNRTGYTEGALMAIGPDALPAFTNLLVYSKFPQTGNLIGAFANAVYANRISPQEAATALPYLLQVFQSTDSHGRWYAAAALGAVHQHPELCVPLLIAGLKDPTPSVRQASMQSLGRFGEDASVHAAEMADAFDGVDALTRQAICDAFGNFRSKPEVCVPVLVRGAHDTDEAVRVAAVVSLRNFGSSVEQAIPALIEDATDSNQVVRAMALQSLGGFGVKATNALPILYKACSDSDATVRSVATNSIALIKQERPSFH